MKTLTNPLALLKNAISTYKYLESDRRQSDLIDKVSILKKEET